MKKVFFSLLSGVVACMVLMQSANASITFINNTYSDKIYVKHLYGKTASLLPNQGVHFLCDSCSLHSFNVLVRNPYGNLVTVCTIADLPNGEVVRITKILARQTNGGCFSYQYYN